MLRWPRWPIVSLNCIGHLASMPERLRLAAEFGGFGVPTAPLLAGWLVSIIPIRFIPTFLSHNKVHVRGGEGE